MFRFYISLGVGSLRKPYKELYTYSEYFGVLFSLFHQNLYSLSSISKKLLDNGLGAVSPLYLQTTNEEDFKRFKRIINWFFNAPSFYYEYQKRLRTDLLISFDFPYLSFQILQNFSFFQEFIHLDFEEKMIENYELAYQYTQIPILVLQLFPNSKVFKYLLALKKEFILGIPSDLLKDEKSGENLFLLYKLLRKENCIGFHIFAFSKKALKIIEVLKILQKKFSFITCDTSKVATIRRFSHLHQDKNVFVFNLFIKTFKQFEVLKRWKS